MHTNLRWWSNGSERIQVPAFVPLPFTAPNWTLNCSCWNPKLLKHLDVSKIESGSTKILPSRPKVLSILPLCYQLYCMEQNLGQFTWTKLTAWMPTWWGTWDKSWVSNHIPNHDILTKTNMFSMYETLIHRNLRWAGHLVRLDNTRMPKQIEAWAGQNSLSKTPSKETWHGKRFCQETGTKKVRTDHSAENIWRKSSSDTMESN